MENKARIHTYLPGSCPASQEVKSTESIAGITKRLMLGPTKSFRQLFLHSSFFPFGVMSESRHVDGRWVPQDVVHRESIIRSSRSRRDWTPIRFGQVEKFSLRYHGQYIVMLHQLIIELIKWFFELTEIQTDQV